MTALIGIASEGVNKLNNGLGVGFEKYKEAERETMAVRMSKKGYTSIIIVRGECEAGKGMNVGGCNVARVKDWEERLGLGKGVGKGLGGDCGLVMDGNNTSP